MKKIMRLTLASCLLFVFAAGIALAADLPAKDVKILKEAGIPVYKGAEFINGGLGDENVGARFASSAPVEDVRSFYRSKFPSWALNAEYGAWILYVGKPGSGPAAYMGKQQVSVKKNGNLPSWFGLAKNMTTEIIIVVPPE
ncbi:MAG: hypothetical protein GXP52_05600 [Deltaproteobacteria bacterium]|nr:hypothetical protein [Deltaproteobacteria bacterium]